MRRRFRQRNMASRLTSVLCFALYCTTLSLHAATTQQLRADHQLVLDQLNKKDAKGNLPSFDDPQVSELLRRGWRLAGAWAAAYLDAHPNPSKQTLKQIFTGFAPVPRGVKSKYGDFLEYNEYWFQGSATKITDSLYVVDAAYGVEFTTGTFIVVARNRDGHFQSLWDIKDVAEKQYAQRDEIGRWAHLTRRAYYNGPLDVERVIPLATAANGHPRFLIDAFQAADGGTILCQLSIWEWDGTEATPLLIRLYERAADFGAFHFDGTTLRITTKEDLASTFSCGSCPEPRAIWTVRITRDRIKDLGRRFLKPAFQWADELLTKINHGEDTTTLAAKNVSAALKERIRQIKAENKSLGSGGDDHDRDNDSYIWGMLGGCTVLRRGQRGAFELQLDEGQLRFSYVLRQGKPYFTSVRIR